MKAQPNTVPYHLKLPRELHETLEEITSEAGVFKSRIIIEAVNAFLDRKGTDEVAFRLAERFDRVSDQLSRTERHLIVQIEALALFVQYELMVGDPVPQDPELRDIGKKRFDAFVRQVTSRIEAGRLTFAQYLGAKDAAK